MATLQDVVDDARRTINDPDKDAFTDADLLAFANEGLHVLQQRRPELFYGSLTSLPEFYALTDTFPLEARFIPPVVQYVVARAMTKDDEHSVQQRAAAFFQLFGLQVAEGGR